jgi:hypothetical protein
VQSVETKVKNRIYGNGRGWCFTPKCFMDLGEEKAIYSALMRLEQKGVIRKLGHGVYDYPEKHEKLGLIAPSAEKIAKAISDRDKIKIQPSGAYATNILGLDEQVPAKYVFLTEGASRKIKIGRLEIVLKNTTPKNMASAGTYTGLVIQAFRHITKNKITDKMISKIKSQLTEERRRELKKYISYAPAWISKIIRKDILGE